SYLRGPMTRDQIAGITVRHAPPAPADPTSTIATSDVATDSAAAMESTAPPTSDTASTVMPAVATGIAVRYVDVAAPWLPAVGRNPAGTTRAAAIVARVSLRYGE